MTPMAPPGSLRRSGHPAGRSYLSTALRRVIPAAAVAFFSASTASAYDYGRPIEISQEEDIYDLYATGDLSEEETDRLIAMFNQKLDLNKATADELYALPSVTLDLARSIVVWRDQVGRFEALEDLERVPGMTPDILPQLAPFTVITAKPPFKLRLTGRVNSKASWNYSKHETIDPADAEFGKSYRASELGLGTLPEAFVRYRGEVADKVKVGAVASMSEGIASYVYDEAYREIYITRWGRPLFTAQKGFAMMSGRNWEAIAGSYGVGFGQKLVFDETNHYQPKGIYPDDQVNSYYTFPGGTYGFAYPQRLFGVAGTYRGIAIGSNSIELTAFVSYRGYQVYPSPYPVNLGNLRAYSQTIPNLYQELLQGGHVTFRVDKRTYVGATGYFSRLYSRQNIPLAQDRFGAVGIDFGAALWRVQLNGEFALMNNLSQAFFLRSVFDLGPGEVQVSLRSYGTDFNNPHSRGFADADEQVGDRDRDEAGFYVQGVYRFTRWLTARGSYNHWYRPSLDVWRMETKGRLEISPIRPLQVALWTSWKDKNLAVTGRSREYDGGGTSTPDFDPAENESADVLGLSEAELEAEASDGDGSKGRLALEVEGRPLRNLILTASYKRIYEDSSYEYYNPDCTVAYDWQVGQDAWFKARYVLGTGSAATARIRYLDEDVFGSKGERAYQLSLQWEQRIGKSSFGLRYSYTGDLAGHTMDIDTFCEDQTDGSCPADAAAETVSAETTSYEPTHGFWASFETKF